MRELFWGYVFRERQFSGADKDGRLDLVGCRFSTDRQRNAGAGAGWVFLGLSALLVAAGVGLGLISGIMPALLVWTVSSVGMVLGLRSMAKKFLPAEASRENTDEDLNFFGSEVEVIEACDDAGTIGRIRFQGTTWPAQCIDGRIEAGQKAQIAYRDKTGLGWMIEATEEQAALPTGDAEPT